MGVATSADRSVTQNEAEKLKYTTYVEVLRLM